jgi:hypothetical protein
MAGLLQDKKRVVLLVIMAVLSLAIAWVAAPFLPAAVDWHTAFRPAAWAVLSGHSPYDVEGYFNPPWAVLPLIPLAILPEPVGRILLVIVSLASFAYVARRLGASKVATVALLVSPVVMHEVLNGNIDWLAVIGLVLPTWLGLFFVVIKPQIGIAVVAYWAYASWKSGGVKELLKTFAPVVVAYGLSILIFGPWPLRATREVGLWWNASLWPVSIPVGLALLAAAIHRGSLRFAMAASPCLSPYVLFHSWVIALMAIITSTPETVVAVVGLWILVAIRTFGG